MKYITLTLAQDLVYVTPPFKLIPFPTERKDPGGRKKWVSIVNRKNWVPTANSRICSAHFVDGEPTQINPYPSLNLGYTPSRPIKGRPAPKERPDIKSAVPVKKAKIQLFTQNAQSESGAEAPQPTNSKHEAPESDPESSTACNEQPDSEQSTSRHVMMSDHDYSLASDLPAISDDRDCLIAELQQKVKKLQLENIHLKNQISKNTKSISLKLSCILKNDKKVKFYTGLPTLQSFNDIFNVLQSKVKHMKHWKGPSRVCNPLNYKRVVSKCRKLTLKHEFVLTMMKLRLGLLLEDLADRFGISTTLASISLLHG